MVSDEFIPQAQKVFENIGAVLAEAGMTFANVVKFTNYLVNPDEHLPDLRTVRSCTRCGQSSSPTAPSPPTLCSSSPASPARTSSSRSEAMRGQLRLTYPEPRPLITPDDKNWTWVLERSCPECSFDARQRAG